ncbi:MAG: hypothetical protein HOQ05_12750 [Corynebacteriales bacterium]|nr:hypothetical protein [Mycobacteriales bacterium]
MTCGTLVEMDESRFSDLFADLSHELDEHERAQQRAEVSDRTRREHAAVAFLDRLRGAVGQVVELRITQETLTGELVEVGADWIELRARLRTCWLPVSEIVAIGGMSTPTVAPGSVGAVEQRWTFAFALRRLVRDRAVLTVRARGGQSYTGTLDRVGSDFVELAEHAADVSRRARAVRAVRAIPMWAIELASVSR